MNNTATKTKSHALYELIEQKRIELARALFSYQAISFQLRNAKQVLRISGELVALAATYEDAICNE